jgi:hypothetical protein
VANWTAAQPTPGTSIMNMVVSDNPSTAGPTNADSLTFTVVFSPSVVNVSIDDFQLMCTGTAAGTIAGVTPSAGTSFTVTVGTIVGDGTLRVDLNSGTDIRDALGNMASGYTAGSTVLIDNTPPTTSMAAVTPNPRLNPVDSIAIQFSEPIAGFGVEDLQLTRGGLSVSLSGATLTTSDQQHWTLGNLSAVTAAIGNYQLTLLTAGSGVSDLAGNALAAGGNVTWQTSLPIAGDFNRDRVVDSADFAILLAHIGMRSGATFEMGDANYDGVIDILDLNIWKANVGRELTFDGTAPTVSIAAIVPNPRLDPVDSITIQFSEPVVGFDLGDLGLARSRVNVPLSGATLTTTDQQNWTLGNLSAITAPVGTYKLTLVAAGSGITDWAGNALTAGGNVTWQTSLPTAGDFNRDGAVDLADFAVLRAHSGMRSGATFEMGDANRDGAVDILDLNIWKANSGQRLSGGSAGGGQPTRVPVSPSKCLSAALLQTSALPTAHDAVFSQLEEGRRFRVECCDNDETGAAMDDRCCQTGGGICASLDQLPRRRRCWH